MFKGGLRFSGTLQPGTYTLLAGGYRANLRLEPGDKPVIRWDRDEEGRFVLKVPAYTDVELLTGIERIPAEAGGGGSLRMTVPHSAVTTIVPEMLEMTATLEQPLLGRPVELGQQRPPFAWFEVRPVEAAVADPRLRLWVENQTEPRIAPAWKITAGPWVARQGQNNPRTYPARVDLDGYWVDSFPGDAPGFTITQPKDPGQDLKEINQTPGVGDAGVTVEKLALETDGGNRYLTAQIRFEPGKPVLMRILSRNKDDDLEVGKEHKYFLEPNVYLARFGPLREEDLERPLAVKLYSIDRVKEIGQRMTLRIEPGSLGPADLLENLGSGD
jgi:hypothetical protein